MLQDAVDNVSSSHHGGPKLTEGSTIFELWMLL